MLISDERRKLEIELAEEYAVLHLSRDQLISSKLNSLSFFGYDCIDMSYLSHLNRDKRILSLILFHLQRKSRKRQNTGDERLARCTDVILQINASFKTEIKIPFSPTKVRPRAYLLHENDEREVTLSRHISDGRIGPWHYYNTRKNEAAPIS